MTEGSDLEAKVESVPTQPGQNAYSQPSSLTSGILNKLTSAVKKAAIPLVLGAALLIPQCTEKAESAVANFKTRNSMGYDLRVLQPNGMMLYVPVEFDNTTEPNGTKHIEIPKVNYPTNVLEYVGTVKNLGTNDFFAGAVLTTDRRQINDTIRTTSGTYSIKNKRGKVAEYVFRVKSDAPLGLHKIEFGDIIAKDQYVNRQEVSPIPLHFLVVTNGREYLKSGEIKFIMDQDKGNVQIHIPAFEKTYISHLLGVRATEDFKTWQYLGTNSYGSDISITYAPLEIIDLNRGGNKRFYEVFEVK